MGRRGAQNLSKRGLREGNRPVVWKPVEVACASPPIGAGDGLTVGVRRVFLAMVLIAG
jgi:hypothetical protein